MPLLDHFHLPRKDQRPWEGFHTTWANAIVMQMNESVLSPAHVALLHIKLGMPIEVDAATMEHDALSQAAQNGGVATAVYAPPRPPLTFPVDFSTVDTFEIKIHEESGLKLVGAIELVSPANKDRPAHREAFVRKCASYLQEGVGLMIVDIVTERSANLHAALVQELAGDLAIDLSESELLYAVAYRARFLKDQDRIEAWPERLDIGRPLPTLPLWLSDVLAVPVNLEQSYLAACKILRIRGG